VIAGKRAEYSPREETDGEECGEGLLGINLYQVDDTI